MQYQNKCLGNTEKEEKKFNSHRVVMEGLMEVVSLPTIQCQIDFLNVPYY